MHISRELAVTIATICLTHPAIAGSRSDTMERCRQHAIESKVTNEEYTRKMQTCTASARDGQAKFATGEQPPPTVSIKRESGETRLEVLPK